MSRPSSGDASPPAPDRPAPDRPASDRPASDRPASDRPASDRPLVAPPPLTTHWAAARAHAAPAHRAEAAPTATPVATTPRPSAPAWVQRLTRSGADPEALDRALGRSVAEAEDLDAAGTAERAAHRWQAADVTPPAPAATDPAAPGPRRPVLGALLALFGALVALPALVAWLGGSLTATRLLMQQTGDLGLLLAMLGAPVFLPGYPLYWLLALGDAGPLIEMLAALAGWRLVITGLDLAAHRTVAPRGVGRR